MPTISLEIEINFDGTYSPATPDVMYLRNGDPGYPGDPAEWEITKINSVTFSRQVWDSEKQTKVYKDFPIDLDELFRNALLTAMANDPLDAEVGDALANDYNDGAYED